MNSRYRLPALFSCGTAAMPLARVMTDAAPGDETVARGLKPLSTLSMAVAIPFGLTIMLATVLLIYDYFYIDFYNEVQNATRHSPESVTALTERADRLDAGRLRIFVLAAIVSVVGAVLFLVWMHRAVRNLETAAIPDRRFSPGWAVGWWFIPIANLFQPVRVMTELNWATGRLARSANPIEAGLIGWWWAGWIANLVLGRIANRTARSESLEDLVTAAWFDVASNVTFIVAGGLAILIVHRISLAQDGAALSIDGGGG